MCLGSIISGMEDLGREPREVRLLPELPGESLAVEDRPVFVPEKGNFSFKTGERVEVLVVHHQGRALAAFNLSANNDPDDPISVLEIENDLTRLVGGSGLDYVVGDYPLRHSDFDRLGGVEVHNTADLGLKQTYEYTDLSDDKGE